MNGRNQFFGAVNNMAKIQTLLRYQRADMDIQQVEQALRSTDNRKKLAQLRKVMQAQRASMTKAAEDLDNAILALGRLNTQCEVLLRRYEIENSELDIMKNDEETTGEEMTELRKDIEKLSKECAALEKEAKQLLDNVNKLTEDYKQAKKTGTAARKEHDALKVVCEQESNDSASLINEKNAKLKELEAKVDPELMAKYRKARQFFTQPVVPVVNSKCGGCNMSLPTLMLNRLQAPDRVAECENCGRLLYIKQDN